MARKYIDCRDHADPKSSKRCSVAISADTKEEVVDVAMQHAVAAHGYKDTAELREQLRGAVKEGTPRA
jgi:predicted small metal-binding protein